MSTLQNKLILALALFFLVGCTSSDIRSLTTVALSKNPTTAFQSFAKTKTTQYAVNPKRLMRDIKSMNNFLKDFKNNISKSWGNNNVKIPQKKEYVKYMQNYKSRTLIDFDKGIVTVETLDDKNAKKSLKDAIVTTLLLPDDPRSVDLFSSKPVKLGNTPYLLGEVKDDQNKNIRYSWRANRFANILTTTKFQQKNIIRNGKKVKVSYVNIPMVKDHTNIRVAKFKPIVKKYAKKYHLSENLLYAIIRTESNFNQFAVSGAGAIGLMQIVPSSAGKDAYRHAKGKNWTPSKSYLFNASHNIELGSAYIQILDDKYLYGISNPISKEYCVISAYNTGSGNVLKTFSANKTRAITIINRKRASEIYSTLRRKLPYVETRNYLKKVVTYKKEFVNI